MRKYWGVLFLAVGPCAAPAVAADLPTEKPAPAPIPEPALSSTWHFEAAIDGWAPSLNASMGVRNLPALPVYANIFQILPHLEGIIPVSVVFTTSKSRCGRWPTLSARGATPTGSWRCGRHERGLSWLRPFGTA